jgi:hypothetical protein
MTQVNTISQEVFNTRMQRAIQFQPIRKTISLGNLQVINTGVVEINGAKISMTKKAFSNLARILGVPIQFQGKVDKLFGEEASRAIVNKMKGALIQQGLSQITAIASPVTKEIVGFVKKESQYISNVTFFEIANNILSDHNLLVRDFTVNHENGAININTFNPNSNFGLAGLKDEFFQGGISLSNSIEKGILVSPYLNRLVCTNGLIGESFSENYALRGIHDLQMREFRDHLQQLEKRQYKPMEFEERVNTGINTMASFAELEAAAELIMNNSGAKPHEIESWIPYISTQEAFAKFGKPTIFMSHEMKKNAKTGTSVWEVVNGLTHFSTHESAFKVGESNRRQIQKEAGNIIAGKFDMENQIVSPFN